VRRLWALVDWRHSKCLWYDARHSYDARDGLKYICKTCVLIRPEAV